MVQQESINTTQDYVNYTFNIETRGVSMVAGELIGLSNTVNNILGDIAFKTSELLSHTEMLAVGVSLAIGGAFAAAAKNATRFEQQMANVKAIGGESLNVKEIGNAAMEYSNKFGMATASMTEGLEALARAGITTTKVMQGVLEEGVKLSTLEGIDLEDSINDLISTTNLLATNDVDMNDMQYAEMVKEMNQHIVSTSESAPINAQNIIQSLQHVGGYASASGIDQDDLFAVIAQLGARGTKGEMAGTALRAFVAAGQKDTAQRALARIGLNVSDLWNDNGETMLSISEMKDVLDKAMENKGYSKQEKLEFYSDFAGYKQANQIMKIDTSEVEQYKEKINNAWDLGQKLNIILNTVHNNINRIWQITQNFMTKVGSKILFAANAILTPVRMLLELVTKIPFADTGVAVLMIVVGFRGILKLINNIVPRFSSFFMEISRVRTEMLDVKNIWRQLPDDIDRAGKTLKAISNPQQMLELQKEHQLYSQKDMDAVEDKVARLLYIDANWNNENIQSLEDDEKSTFLIKAFNEMDPISKQLLKSEYKINHREDWDDAIKDYLTQATRHISDSVADSSYDIGSIIGPQEALISIDKYIKLIWKIVDDFKTPPDNRQRNADMKQRFNNIKNDVMNSRSEYGDYSYRINSSISPRMRQLNYNDLSEMRDFEQQVINDIQRKQEMYIRFMDDKSIEEGRNRLKKSLTVAAKTDLGYEFSTGANTSDIKKILETGNIREGSSHITRQQLQDIANVLNTSVTGNVDVDMAHFYNILKDKDDKDILLDQILQKTQKTWNDKYYNNGKVGFFPTKALEQASNGETLQKILQKTGAHSIGEVQEMFKTVSLDNSLLNACVDIMYEDKELVDTLIAEEINYMYENLARVQNSIQKKVNESEGFRSEGDKQYETNLQKAREYVLSDFNPNEFSNFSASPYGQKYDLSTAIEFQNDEILSEKNKKQLEGFQGYIYPIGTDIANFQRYGDNFKIRNIKHLPYNELLEENVTDVFFDTASYGDTSFDFMETFADWVYNEASSDGHYWHNSFDYNYAEIYHNDTGKGFASGQEQFDDLKEYLEGLYRGYIKLCAYGAQSLIEAQELYDATITYRGGQFYTPENDFGVFDTITSTSFNWGVAKDFWQQSVNQGHRSSILEIYNPADIPAVIAHYDILNSRNSHLWSRERELTLGMGQPYLHMPNPDKSGLEKRILVLTADQQKAVKEIMGEDFEFKSNKSSSSFLNAGEPDYGDSFNQFDKKFPNLHKNHKPIKLSKYLDTEEIKKKSAIEKKYRMMNQGESSTIGVGALNNIVPAPLNKDILTKENLSEKIQDFFLNGNFIVGSKGYGQGFLGEADGKGTIDVRPGVIKYYSDEDSDTWGKYGNALLDTIVHEMTHTLMMHTERQDYKNNNIPAELGIDNFEIPQQLLGYTKNFVAEYEAQYVSSQVFKRLGLEVSQKNQQRINAFEDLIKHKGYEDQIQYELLDQLVEDMLANISTIGDITESLSTQWNMTEANVTSSQIAEDMRPLLTKIQAFDKDMIPYQGNNLDSKKDEVEQVLSDMETDMELLWSSGVFDKELIYNMVAQKYAPYIETLDGVNLNQFLEHAAPKFKKITPNLIAEMFLDKNTDKYVKEFVKNDLNEVLNPLIKEEKENDPNKRLRQTLSGYKEVPLEDFTLLLPLHSAEPVTNSSGEYNQGYMNKFIFNRPKDVTTGPLGVRNILDSDIVQGLDLTQKVQIAKAILDEEMYHSVSDLMSVDKKLSGAIGWLVVNTDTGVTCMNRMTDGICEFADACYAFMGTMRPAGLKKQLEKMIFYSELGPEELANEISQRGGKVVRINQEGEFNSVDDFLKIKTIAERLSDVQFYGYTKNQDVLKEIIKNGLPDNLTINDSLGRTHGAQYMSVPQNKIIDFLEAGYLLCKGACATCEQCLNDIKKVTILRDGSQTLGVEDVAHLNRKGQKVVFQTLKEYEEAGIQVTKELTKEIIDDVSAASEMVRKNNTVFKNEGETTSQSTLDDFIKNKTKNQQNNRKKTILTRQETLNLRLGLENATKRRKQLKKLQEEQKKLYQEEREYIETQKEQQAAKYDEGRKKEKERLQEKWSKNKQENKTQDNRSIWDKIREAIVVGTKSHYYYFGGEKKIADEEGQAPWQKKMQNWGLKATDKTQGYVNKGFEKLSNFNDTYYDEEKVKNVNNKFSAAKEGITAVLEPMKQFNAGLERAAEIFPPLTIATTALNTVIEIGEGVVWALGIAETLVNGAKTYETLMNTGLFASEQALIISRALETATIWALDAAIAALEILISGPVLIAIAAIIAAIILLKFWENKHAEALKESQKALEEATAKNNIALSQYKDLKKARESETDAIKKQQLARKEAIALYELEAARIKKRKAVHEEAKLRNDSVWGEYGIRATMQKMGLGLIAGGDFESQYENYDGTTKNIRQIKEGTLGNLFASQEQRYVASVYDRNSDFFAEVEAYKEPLQELYDKESKLIEQYGSIDLARGTKEFEEAVQEFADATGINGETAVMMLNWLETENRVNQATKVGQAEIGMIRARADAKIMGIDAEESNLDDTDNLGRAMVMAQFQDMMNTAKTEVWWELLFAYLDTFISILLPWKWGEVSGNLKKVGVRQEELHELDEEGNKILNDMYDAYDSAERRDYGTGSLSSYHDTPFGGAVSSAATMYAEEEQNKMFNETGQVMSEDDYKAVQSQYQEQEFGITEEKLKQQKMKDNEEAYQKAQQDKQKKANTTLGQLQNNGEQAHQDALDIIDAIKNNPGAVSGAGAGIMSIAQSEDPIIKSLRKKGMRDIFDFMAGEEGTFTGKIVNKAKGHFENAEAAYADDGLRGVYQYGKNTITNSNIWGRITNRTGRDALAAQKRGYMTAADREFLANKYGIDISEARTSKQANKMIRNTLDSTGQWDEGMSALHRSKYGRIAQARQFGTNLVQRGRSGLSSIATEIKAARGVYRTDGLGGLKGYAEGALYSADDAARGFGRNALEYGRGVLTQGRGIAQRGVQGARGLYNKGVGRITDRISLAREANALAADGMPISRNGIDKAVGVFDNAKAAYADDGLKGLANFGKEAGKDGIRGLTQAGKAASGELGGIRGIASSVSSEVGGVKGLASTTASGMKDILNPKALAGGVDDIAKGLGGSGSLAKGIGKVGGRALAVLGPALAFADKASELNPFEGKHYNEDGTEKKALQATGEVVGTTAGALGGVAGGLAGAEAGAALGATIGSVIPGVGTVIGGALGAVAGGIAGGWLGDTIFQPIGDAIGGTIGWLGDNLLGGIQNVAGTVWDGLTGAAGGVWDAVSGAASGAWDFLTGANDESNNPVKGILGWTPIGMGINAAAGIGEWLSGGDGKNDPYAKLGVPNPEGKVKEKGTKNENTIIIKNININTEDDPEKIKSALMNLIIEMQEQVAPRTVSRTVGEPPAASSTSDTQNTNNQAQAEGTDPQSGEQNGNSTTNNNGNTNPTS